MRDVRKALEHYRKLGFEGTLYDEEFAEEPFYAFVSSGDVELHLSLVPEVDPKTSLVACYLYVDDADALHAAWRAAGVEGRLTDPEDTPYGLREFGHVDPDGNLLRVGSPLANGG